MFVLFIACLIFGVPVFFVCRWAARRWLKDPATRQVVPWVATLVLTPLLCAAGIVMWVTTLPGNRNYNFDTEQWAAYPGKRYFMVEDLVDSDILRGMDRIQVRQLLGNPDFRTADSVWVYSIRGDKDDMLEVTFRHDRVTAVRSPHEGVTYKFD